MGGIYQLLYGNTNTNKQIDAGYNNMLESSRLAREQTDLAGKYMLQAQEMANAGMLEAAGMAAEESRAAREQSLAYIKEATAEAQKYLDSTLGSTAPHIRKAQEESLAILDEYSTKAADLYRPYIGAGEKALKNYQELADKGVTLSGGKIVSTTSTPGQAKTYEQWKSERPLSTGGSQTWNEQTGQYEQAGPTEEQLQAQYQEYVSGVAPTTTTTETEAPYDIQKSPYYGLYKFQQDQQQKSIDANLSARGLYNSGKGIQEQVNADTGLTESFAATEYQRATDDYTRKMQAQGALMGVGYEASGNLANIYNATGTNKANVAQWAGGALANLQSQVGTAKANAAMGQGTSLANISQQSGTQLANINSQLGTNLSNTAMTTGTNQANSANQLGTNLANIYMNYGNNQASILNNAANNRMNMFAGAGRTATSIANSNRNNNTNNNTNWSYDSVPGGDQSYGMYDEPI